MPQGQKNFRGWRADPKHASKHKVNILFIILVYHILKFCFDLKVASELYTGKSLSSSFTNYRNIIIRKSSKEKKEEKNIF